MAPIPVWSGNLRLSLVLVPVRMFPATSTEGAILRVDPADLRPREVSDRMTRWLGEIQSRLTDETRALIVDLRLSVAALQNEPIRLNVRHVGFLSVCRASAFRFDVA